MILALSNLSLFHNYDFNFGAVEYFDTALSFAVKFSTLKPRVETGEKMFPFQSFSYLLFFAVSPVHIILGFCSWLNYFKPVWMSFGNCVKQIQVIMCQSISHSGCFQKVATFDSNFVKYLSDSILSIAKLIQCGQPCLTIFIFF